MSRSIIVGIAIVAVLVLVLGGGGAFWWSSQQQISHEYTDALALCERSPAEGAAKIDALDQLYGEGARPDALLGDLLACRLDRSIDRARHYNSLLDN